MNHEALNRLRSGRTCIGTWISTGSPVIAEIAAQSDFDWLLFDLEHGCGTEANLLPQLQAIRRGHPGAIVRVGAPHPDLILHALDWGAEGIMVPHVSSAAEAEACVQAMHYPPRGRRGFARSPRTYGYGLAVPGASDTIPAPLLMAQIETIEGVAQARQIARVDGVDVLFVGPADLQFDLNARPGLATRDYAGCLEEVASASREAGKSCGILIRGAADLQKHLDLGFTHVAIDSDIGLLRNGFQNIVASARSQVR